MLGLDSSSPAPPFGGGRLWGDGFEIETLINMRVAEAGLAVTEVPSYERSRLHGVSNLNAASDGLRVLRTIVAERRRAARTRRVAGRPAGAGAPAAARHATHRLAPLRAAAPAGAGRPLDRPLADAAVIVCAYTEERWRDTVAAVESLRRQTVTPAEIVLVVDHNERLLARARELPGVLALANSHAAGAAGARNTGIAATRAAVVAFLDDDAVAERDWLELLLRAYDRSDVAGVGGRIVPRWPGERPAWFPPEFDWVVGCTYSGLPPAPAQVRNLIGANMSVRREVLERVGGFREGYGNVKAASGAAGAGWAGERRASSCEDTELCIRVSRRFPELRWLYEPGATVLHRVPPHRGTWRYFLSRSREEGLAKAALVSAVGAGGALSAERVYTRRTLPAGVARGLQAAIARRDPDGLRRAASIGAGLALAAEGYAEGRLRVAGRRAARLVAAEPVAAPAIVDAPAPSVPGALAGALPDGSQALRLALVSPRFSPAVGGLETHVLELGRRLAARGVDVEVLTQTDDPALPAVERLAGVTVRRFPVVVPSTNFAVALGLPRFLARQRARYDLVHVHNYHALPALGGALLAGDRPVVFTPHYHGTGHSPLRAALHRPYRLAGRRLFDRADHVVCVSQAEAELVGRHFPEAVAKITVVPNGVDAAAIETAVPYPSDARRRVPATRGAVAPARDRERLVLSVGRLEAYKNVDAVVRALGELDDSYRLVVVGDGPAAARLRASVAPALVDRVQFVGRIDRASLCRWYRTAAVYVNASDHEAFGIGALEALAGGAAVVLSDIPAHREVAERYAGARGRLVDRPCEPPRLAAAIRAAAQRREAAVPDHAGPGEAAVPDHAGPGEAALLLPTWDEVADRTLDLYLSALGRSTSRQRMEVRQVA